MRTIRPQSQGDLLHAGSVSTRPAARECTAFLQVGGKYPNETHCALQRTAQLYALILALDRFLPNWHFLPVMCCDMVVGSGRNMAADAQPANKRGIPKRQASVCILQSKLQTHGKLDDHLSWL